MDDYVEQFACKLDEAKMIAAKMSVNQKVEVLKYVFLFIEHLQKDLIEKLTRHGSIVTFSFVPEIGIENCLKTVVSQTVHSNARRIKQEGQSQDLYDHHQSSYFDRSVNCKQENTQNRDSFAEVSYELNESCSRELLPNCSEGESSLLCSIRETRGDLSVSAAPESTSARPFENAVCKSARKSSSNHGRRPDDEDDFVLPVIKSEELFADSSVVEPSWEEFNQDGRKRALEGGTGGRTKRRRRSRKKSKLGRPSLRERIDGKYWCTFPGCSEKYSGLEHVTDHELQHTVPDGHFYSCPHCTEKFKWRHYLRIHVKTNHAGEVSPAAKSSILLADKTLS